MILRDSLTKNNFFSTRVCLIPKKDPLQFRRIQVNNILLRLVEKWLLDQISEIELQNKDSIQGFVKKQSMHSAYDAVKKRLDTTIDPCLFIDLNKAYNSLNRAKLIDIVQRKVKNPLIVDTLTQIINKQNCNIDGQYFHCTEGVPQGSAVSPWLFKALMDEAIINLKDQASDVTEIVAYADDLVVFGSFKYQQLRRVLEDFGLSVNEKKTVAFRRRIKGIQTRKRFNYLGYGID